MTIGELRKFIISLVEGECNTTVERMRRNSKDENRVTGKRIATHLLYTYTGMSYPDIARLFGNTGHSTFEQAHKKYPTVPRLLRETLESEVKRRLPQSERQP
jgi:chromosomal replication initiation ATPase DnaA